MHISLVRSVFFYTLMVLLAFTCTGQGQDGSTFEFPDGTAGTEYTTGTGTTVVVTGDDQEVTVADPGFTEITTGSGAAEATYPVLGGVTVDFGPTGGGQDAVVSIPNVLNLTSAESVIVGEVVNTGQGNQGLAFTNTVSLSPDLSQLVTNTAADQTNFLSNIGVDSPGTFLFVQLPKPAGYVTGKLTSEGTATKQGLEVGTSGGNVIGETDKQGYYSIASSKESNIFYSYENKSGNYGAEYTMVGYGVTTLDIDLQGPNAITKAPSNGCYNEAQWMAYNKNGNLQIKNSQQTIKPTEGTGMAFITTGPGAYQNKLSKFSMTFTVEKGNDTIELDYNFMSDEYPEWVGSVYNDLFNIVIYSKDKGAQLIANETINGSKMTPSSSGFDGEIGWQHISIDVSAYAKGKTPITLEFLVSDVADTIFDSAAVVDNLYYGGSNCKASENSAIKNGGKGGKK